MILIPGFLLLIAYYGRTVKAFVLMKEPATFFTVIFPLIAPNGTLHVTEVEETTVIWSANITPLFIPLSIVLKRTSVTPVRFAPEIVTSVPTLALVGVK